MRKRYPAVDYLAEAISELTRERDAAITLEKLAKERVEDLQVQVKNTEEAARLFISEKDAALAEVSKLRAAVEYGRQKLEEHAEKERALRSDMEKVNEIRNGISVMQEANFSEKVQAAEARVKELEARVPREPFDLRCADALADEVAVLVRTKAIDARSPAADALLDYRNPPTTERSDRLAAAEARERKLVEALTHVFDVLTKYIPSGHQGDEESGRCDDDCERCAFEQAIAHVELMDEPESALSAGEKTATPLSYRDLRDFFPPRDRRVLVCGGVSCNRGRVWEELEALDDAIGRIATVIHGSWGNTDLEADCWARQNHRVICAFRIDSEIENAAIALNHRMLKEGRPDVIAAFPGGPTTDEMVTHALVAGVPVIKVLSSRAWGDNPWVWAYTFRVLEAKR